MVTELEPNRKLSPDHLPFILNGAMMGAGSLWLTFAPCPHELVIMPFYNSH